MFTATDLTKERPLERSNYNLVSLPIVTTGQLVEGLS